MPEEESIPNKASADDVNKEVETPSTLTQGIQEDQNEAARIDSPKESIRIRASSEDSTGISIPAESEKPTQSAPVGSILKETESMEVHRPHPHHAKRWTDYFFEFFMLFLAVILGFLFENLREHYVEHQRAKQYAQSLYNDLKKDAEQVNNLTHFKKWRGKQLDSLLIVTSPSMIQANASEAYYYSCVLVVPNPPFRPSDITVQQLRNSGTLRYFSITLINRITKYYSNCHAYTEIENEFGHLNPPYSLTAKIFDADLQASLFPAKFEPDLKNVVRRPDTNKEFKLLGSYELTLNEYRLYVGKQKRGNDGMINLLHQLVANPREELIEALQNEYTVR